MNPLDAVQNTTSPVQPESSFGALPPVDPSRLSPTGQATYRALTGLHAEAAGWGQVGLLTGDQGLITRSTTLASRIASAVAALGQGAPEAEVQAVAAEVVAELRALDGQMPARSGAPRIDTSRLSGDGAALFANIQENRAALVGYHGEAAAEGRGDVARRIAMEIRKLDLAASILASDPGQGYATARALAEEVHNGFESVDAAWNGEPPAFERGARVVPLAPAAAEAETSFGPTSLIEQADRVDTRPTPGAGAGLDPTSGDARIAALEAGLLQAQEENRLLRERIDAKERAEAEEARKPGFFRALIEALEFMLRWFTPFVNMLSALFRVLKIGYKLLTGQKVDWMKEGARLAGDVAGIFFPPIGAIANAGINIFTNESQILGGVNELFDDTEKKNPFREGFNSITGAAGRAFTGARNAVLGDPRDEIERREAMAAQTI